MIVLFRLFQWIGCFYKRGLLDFGLSLLEAYRSVRGMAVSGLSLQGVLGVVSCARLALEFLEACVSQDTSFSFGVRRRARVEVSRFRGQV